MLSLDNLPKSLDQRADLSVVSCFQSVCDQRGVSLPQFNQFIFGAPTRAERGSALRPLTVGGLRPTAAPKFLKRTVSGKSVSALGSQDDLHATQHGESQCKKISLQTGSISA